MTLLPVPSRGALHQILVMTAMRLRRLDPATRSQVERLYADLRHGYAPTCSEGEQRAAAMAFIDGLLAIPELREDIEGIVRSAAPEPARGLDLPERLEDLEPRAAAAAPPPLAAPTGAEPSEPRTRGLKKRSLKKSAKKNGHPRAAAANGGGTRGGEPGVAREEGAGAPEERAPLTRYPELDVPARMALRVETAVTVALALEPSTPGAAAMSVADTGPEPPVIELVLRAPGFEIAGSNTQKMTVHRSDASSTRFKVTPVREGPARISVDFYQDERRIGTVSSETVVGGGPAIAAASTVDPIEFARTGATPPDLEIRVVIDRQDPRTLHFTLHSTIEAVDKQHAGMGSVQLLRSPMEEIQLVYAELSKMAGKAPKTDKLAQEQRERLAAIGRQLWERLLSKELQDSYWEWRDRVNSVLITSDEPWIPWEIVRPFRFETSGRRVDDPHWCERFDLTRWLSGPGAADSISVRSLQGVAPKTSDLAAVDAELKAFEKLTTTRTGLTAEQRCSARADLIRTFESGGFSILHVASHGSFDSAAPDNSAIKLSDGEVRPSDISARFGGGRPRPVVFINACHGGRLEHTFTGIGGWADRLVKKARVGAFVGAAWEVNDRLALLFADRFYASLLKDGRTLGESFRLARQAIRDAEPSNSTWLAYVLYSDPAAAAAKPA